MSAVLDLRRRRRVAVQSERRSGSNSSPRGIVSSAEASFRPLKLRSAD
jgi:hypothetical protein